MSGKKIRELIWKRYDDKRGAISIWFEDLLQEKMKLKSSGDMSDKEKVEGAG